MISSSMQHAVQNSVIHTQQACLARYHWEQSENICIVGSMNKQCPYCISTMKHNFLEHTPGLLALQLHHITRNTIPCQCSSTNFLYLTMEYLFLPKKIMLSKWKLPWVTQCSMNKETNKSSSHISCYRFKIWHSIKILCVFVAMTVSFFAFSFL